VYKLQFSHALQKQKKKNSKQTKNKLKSNDAQPFDNENNEKKKKTRKKKPPKNIKKSIDSLF